MKTEEFKVNGSDILKKIKALIKEGNIRKITVKDRDGKSIAEFPLTVGVVGTVILPVVAAISTIIALVAECTISVEKELETQSPNDSDEIVEQIVEDD